MKCEKCGYVNDEYDVICQECGASLKIEENEFLNYPYHNKGIHIDIEEIKESKNRTDFNQLRKKVFTVVTAFLIFIIVLCLYFLINYLLDEGSKDFLNTYSYLMENSPLTLFYLGDKDELNSLCEEYSTKYHFDYLHIPMEKLSMKRRRQIQRDLNISQNSAIFVIVESGTSVLSTQDVETSDNLLSFLQDNEIIPKYLGNPDESLESFRDAFLSEKTVLLYLPTSYFNGVEECSESLKSIAEQYALEYYEVKGYFLSKKQLLKIMSQLGFSEIQTDLILYIEDGKVVKTIVDNKHNSYFNLLSSYGIIDISDTDSLINISAEEFQNFVSDEKEKYVILIESDNCPYCDRVKPILGKIANQYQINIYRLNVSTNWDIISSTIQELGVELGLTSTPFLLVMEKNTILDYIIGLATKELYIDKLTELGVIR